jgi:hypothetical protein
MDSYNVEESSDVEKVSCSELSDFGSDNKQMGVLFDDDIDKKPVQNELFKVDRTYDYLPQGTF